MTPGARSSPVPSSTPSTRDAILDAAERLFARQGFAATTIKQIGAESGVNSALLYYYFADKETLYREMIRRAIGGFAATARQRLTEESDPEQAIRRFIRFQVEFMTANPRVLHLLVRELVEHEAKHAAADIAPLAANFYTALRGIVERGQESGRFRRELDPRFAAISVISQAVWMIIARPAAGVFLGYGTAGPPREVMLDFADHAADFALTALRATRPAPGRRSAATAGKSS